MGGALSLSAADCTPANSREIHEPGAVKRLRRAWAALLVLTSPDFATRAASSAEEDDNDEARKTISALSRLPREICVLVAQSSLRHIRLVDGTLEELRAVLAIPTCDVVDLGGLSIRMPEPQPALLLDRNNVTIANGSIHYHSGARYRPCASPRQPPDASLAPSTSSPAGVDSMDRSDDPNSRLMSIPACAVVLGRGVTMCNVCFVEDAPWGAGSQATDRAPSLSGVTAVLVDGGEATLQGCLFQGCGGYAVQAIGGARMAMQACDIFNTRGPACVGCFSRSEAVLEGCSMRKVAGMGCVAQAEGSMRLERCRLSTDHPSVYVMAEGVATVADCEFVGVPMAAVRAKGSGSEVTLAGSNLFRGCTGAPISANLLGMVRVKGMVGVERLGEERQNFSAHGGGRWTDQVAVGTQGGKVLFDLE